MKIKTGVVLLLLALSSGVNALGFRNISVTSYLNEPLDARIGLVSISQAEIDQLKIALANPDAFEKAGLIRPLLLTKLRFDIKTGDDGKPFVQVTTRQGVREPFLNFLLEVTWKGNKLLREYTVLLDPRVTPIRRAQATVPSAPVAAKRSSTARSAVRSGSKPLKSYGPVKRSETLWVIAKRVRPNRSISVEQMMMALLDANPNAFRHGNVNYLKQGATLAIPGEEMINVRSARQARADFRQQNRDWKGLRRGAMPKTEMAVVPSAPEVTASTVRSEGRTADSSAEGAPVTDAGVDDGANLRLVETGNEAVPADASAGLAAQQESETDANLRTEIAESKRDLETVREINRDLVELKDALELKIETLRQSLLQRNRTIDRLEQRLNETLAKPRTKDQPTEASSELLGGEQKVSGGVRSEIEMGRASPGSAETKAEPRQEPQDTQQEWMGLLERYWIELTAVGLLLLLLLVVMLVRRRKAEDVLPDSEVFGSYIDDDEQPATQESPMAVGQPETRVQQVTDSEPEETEGGFTPGEHTDVASALTEADIYLAYRRYGQAESLIQQAIESHPENMILKAKLLEIYAFRKDRNRFVEAMEQAYQPMIVRSPEIWAKIVEMGREIAPDHELITGGVLSDNGDDALVNDFSLDLDVDDEPKPRSEGPSGQGYTKP